MTIRPPSLCGYGTRARRGATERTTCRRTARRILLCLSLVAMSAASPAHASSSSEAQTHDALGRLRQWLSRSELGRKADEEALRHPLTRQQAVEALHLLTTDRFHQIERGDRQSFARKEITFDGRTLKWDDRIFGDAPPKGRSLWISLHGGGNAPPEVNEQQWRNQTKLYQPAEGVYLAPRAPTDTWNLWHEPHIDPLLQRLIDIQVAINHVDPDRVFLLGYSAGGDGVWQLAPRMADRFAAAATMAGHPGDAALASLRDLPFAIFMGGADDAYDRNRLAVEKTGELALLHAADPGGYNFMSRVYEGLPHWMNRRDAEALPWMARFRREPWPSKVVWVQDDRTTDRFYWIEVQDGAAKPAARIDGSVNGQTITLSGDVPAGTRLRLSDSLLDLDRKIAVVVNGRRVFAGKVPRTAEAIRTSLIARADPEAAASAMLTID